MWRFFRVSASSSGANRHSQTVRPSYVPAEAVPTVVERTASAYTSLACPPFAGFVQAMSATPTALIILAKMGTCDDLWCGREAGCVDLCMRDTYPYTHTHTYTCPARRRAHTAHAPGDSVRGPTPHVTTGVVGGLTCSLGPNDALD